MRKFGRVAYHAINIPFIKDIRSKIHAWMGQRGEKPYFSEPQLSAIMVTP